MEERHVPSRTADTPDPLAGLLTPSLSQDGPVPALYSVRAGFLVAFFTGGFTSVLFTGLNSRRLGRLQSDLPLLLLGGAFFISFMTWTGMATAPGATLPFDGDATTNGRQLRILGRGLAIAFFGLAYLQHRTFYRANSLSDVDPPSPWKPALACTAVSTVVAVICIVIGRVLA